MSKLRKVFAVLLALTMTLAMGITAFAADITLNTGDQTANQHEYKAYQIFKGTVNGGEISVTGWGDGVDTTLVGEAPNQMPKILKALKDDTTIGSLFADAKTPEAAAKVISGFNADQTIAFAKVIDDNLGTGVDPDSGSAFKWSDLEDGYYLLLDSLKTGAPDDEYLSANIVKLAGTNVSVTVKGSKPSSDKGVEKAANPQANAPTEHITIDNAQANIGDKVFYTLKGVTASNIDKYEVYKWEFVDTLPVGLAFYQIEDIYLNGTSILDTNQKPVKADLDVNARDANATATPPVTAHSGVKVTTPTIKATDAQAAGTADAPETGGGTLKVEYKDLTKVITSEDAAAANLLVVYSAVVTKAATQGGTYDETTNTMYANFTRNPNGDGDGKTPEEKAVVYNVTINLDKYNNQTPLTKLPGAEFQLRRQRSTGSTTTTEYAVVDFNKDTMEGTGKILRWTTNRDEATTLSTGPDGGTYAPIVVKGLESGSYVLVETKAPEGYNQPPAITDTTATEWTVTFTVTATGKGANDAGLSKLEIKEVNKTGNIASATAQNLQDDGATESGNGSISLGQVGVDVQNTNNLTLPSTGGIGTTIFYIVGTLLVLGCAVLFVSKRKMAAK